jgi:hypothetical protein
LVQPPSAQAQAQARVLVLVLVLVLVQPAVGPVRVRVYQQPRAPAVPVESGELPVAVRVQQALFQRLGHRPSTVMALLVVPTRRCLLRLIQTSPGHV